jgi:hypothetical protein
MHFKGFTPDGEEIYSIQYNARPFESGLLKCEVTGGYYRINHDKLFISFDEGESWHPYNEVRK